MEFSTIDIWILWGIAAVICFIFEIFLPSFWMAMLGVGAIGASLSALLGGGTEIQIAVFSFVSIIAGVFFRPLAYKYIYNSNEKKAANVDALIGRKVQVVSKITTEKNGKVKIGSEVWTAISENRSESFNEGAFVTVASVDGAKVIVKSSASEN
ncbi:MAG TPA: NfeD family protein [bacterium]|nr:NfeD family protein [bacterium]HOB72465.1 NfeD family protein [bacterium]HOG43611.1 NfeD family protein [bacterium]HPA56590.1 NfeD family protein [bacterium]HPG36768.1 NfeD family protein [bacterium]